MEPLDADGVTVNNIEVLDFQSLSIHVDGTVRTSQQLVTLPPEILKHIMVQLDSVEDLESLAKSHELLKAVVEANQEISAVILLKNVGRGVFRQLVMAVEVSCLDVKNTTAVDAFFERHPVKISSYKCSLEFTKQAIALMDTVRAVNVTMMRAFARHLKDVPSVYAELRSEFTPTEQDRFSRAALCTEFYSRLLAHYLVRANGGSAGPYLRLMTSGFLESTCVQKAASLFGIVGLASARCFEAELYLQLHTKICLECQYLPSEFNVPVTNCIQLEQAGNLYASGMRGAYGAYPAVAGLARCANFLNPSTSLHAAKAEFVEFSRDISESIIFAHFLTYQDVYHTDPGVLQRQLQQPFGKFDGHEQWILNVWWYKYRRAYKCLDRPIVLNLEPWSSRLSLFWDDWRMSGLSHGELPSFDEAGKKVKPTPEQQNETASQL